MPAVRRLEQHPGKYFQGFTADDSTLFVCIYGQDRSVALHNTFGGSFLEGGLKRLHKIHQLFSGQSDVIVKSKSSKTIEKELREIERQIQTFHRIIICISLAEQSVYAVAYNWLLHMVDSPESLVEEITTIHVNTVSPYTRGRYSS